MLNIIFPSPLDVFMELVLFNQMSKTQRYSVYNINIYKKHEILILANLEPAIFLG